MNNDAELIALQDGVIKAQDEVIDNFRKVESIQDEMIKNLRLEVSELKEQVAYYRLLDAVTSNVIDGPRE